MPRIEPIDAAAATGRTRELLDEFASRGGEPGPMVLAMAIVAFGQQVIAAPAEVTDEQVGDLRELGYTDEQIAEVVGLVSLQLLTGAFNLVAGIHPSTITRSAA